MYVLGVETSCDETAAAVLTGDSIILANVVLSQDELHAPFGGVVPELASRQHLDSIGYVIQEALNRSDLSLEKIDAYGVTQGPGLIGSLLIGLSFVKSLAYFYEKPLIPVDHLEAHIQSAFLENREISFPVLALVVSGGHTSSILMKKELSYKLIGRTRDDAAGEALDKISKFLGLGYPGGPIIEKLARDGDQEKFAFALPRMTDRSLDFSFSGLKTAALKHIKESHLTKNHPQICDFLASFQSAIVRALIANLAQGIEVYEPCSLILCGGVARNGKLREEFSAFGQERNLQTFAPSPDFCTDNAAMVAALAIEKLKEKKKTSFPLDMNAYPRLYSFKGKTWKK
jgi:N6-L-threonylcarbamoyladenine synthase